MAAFFDAKLKGLPLMKHSSLSVPNISDEEQFCITLTGIAILC